jgi:NitT/TauT family transport system substrate-binding protein
MKLSRLLGVALGLVFSLTLAGCDWPPKGDGPGPDNTGQPTTIVLQQEWIPYSGYAGEVVAASRYAAQNGVRIEIREGGGSVDPIGEVLRGAAQIGVASADKVLAAYISSGGRLRVIGVVNAQSPTVFLAPKKANVRSTKDFIGKRVGILEGTNTESIYRLMLAKSSVSATRLEELPVPFTVDTFLLGQYDIRPAFEYDETVALDLAGFEYDTVYPRDEGIKFLGTVYFTTESALEGEKREAIIATVRSLIQGWGDAVDPKTRPEAIKALKAAFPGIEEDRERRSLDKGFAYFSHPEGGPLYSTRAEWEATIAGLAELGKIDPKLIDLKALIDEGIRDAACKDLPLCE